MGKFLIAAVFVLIVFLYPIPYTLYPTFAIVDPLAVPNNKIGIHIIQATPDESSPAAQMVNTNGDWGYITFLIESKDRNHDKWQQFFNDLRRRHLIPLVRLATKPLNEHWERPYDGEEQAWADFLDRLNWPTKNRYVIVYNEPNHGKEWGGAVEAKLYAKVLDKIITALKNKNRDFFVLNGGFDASAPHQPPNYEDQVIFLRQMEEAVPGIFNKLDGWVSHSYPNPSFTGSPLAGGRGTVRTYAWELQLLRQFGVTKNLPIFITETGWQHAEGLNHNSTFPTADTVANYYQMAFQDAWASSRIVAVTPFLLSYQEQPFDHFSFKKITGEKQNVRILGIQYPDFYPQYQTLMAMPKAKGKPVQENKAQLIKGEIFTSIVSGETYTIPFTFKNIGQSIWGDGEAVKLVPTQGGSELGIETLKLPQDIKIEPNQEHTFNLKLQAPKEGSFRVVLSLFTGNTQFDSPPLAFTTEVKSPVILQIKTSLKWKKDPGGEYLLTIKGPAGESIQQMTLNSQGYSYETEARYLLPDYTFEFILEKPFYHAVSIKPKVHPGLNILDFGTLQPDLLSAIFHPQELWKLLPFSN